MYREYVQEPLYLSVARWVMQQKRWVSATEIAEHFNLTTCKAINTVSYILSEVSEIVCKTKSVPNQLEGRGCQCQRLIQVDSIDDLISSRIKNAVNAEGESDSDERLEQGIRVPPSELNREQKWQWMLSKGQRK
ncbi:carnitine metabolism transcriptional regulator CaiF [Leminorella grimontii]|uniref:carnitine metabolism transcriptional regulator CaiF n=1 Tax=Leminorella grimontii TaxID=82981 RepID=UPI00208688AF|nr:carnitine metabolism transcriptional regulator CaiF [Leminorella grimontii]GKX61363.1 transcriptional activator CaiF [Leminorella grimontii]